MDKRGCKDITTFVSHRLAEICESTLPNEWRWVPSELNVADDATKFPAKDQQCERWISGPSFLRESEDGWPLFSPHRSEEITENTEKEKRKAFVGVVAINSDHSWSIPRADRFSSWNRLIRATAQVLVAIECFKGRTGGALQPIDSVRQKSSE